MSTFSDGRTSVRVGQAQFSGTRSCGGGAVRDGVGSDGPRDGEVGNIYHLFEKKAGVPHNEMSADPFPVVKRGKYRQRRTHSNALEVRRRAISRRNTLFVNSDFRVFNDMIARLGLDVRMRLGRYPWTQALIETVIGARLKGSKEWTSEVH